MMGWKVSRGRGFVRLYWSIQAALCEEAEPYVLGEPWGRLISLSLQHLSRSSENAVNALQV